MQNTNLRITHAFFFQHAIARLMLKGMWFSDALEVMTIIWPERNLPDDWDDPFYNITREVICDQQVPMPHYQPIW